MPQSNVILTFNENTAEYDVNGVPAKLMIKGEGYEFKVGFDYPLELHIDLDNRRVALITGYGDPIINQIVLMESNGHSYVMCDTLGVIEIPAHHPCLQFITTA